MKLIKTSETVIERFSPELLMDLITKGIANGKGYDGKFEVSPDPIIECEGPKLTKSSPPYNEYEYRVFNHIRLNPVDSSRENVIFQTRKSFVYTKEPGISEKAFFEFILTQADKEFSEEFFFNYYKVKERIKELDNSLYNILEKVDFYFLKIGTQYRLFPQVDYYSFF